MTLPSLPRRPAGLPKFGRPPLREVAIAVLFQPLAGLAQPHIGQYWELIRDRYPKAIDQPPIEPYRPYLESGERGRPAFQFQVGPPPLRRSWFISDDDERLVQLQSDRFVHNWRGDGADYPHLDDLWASFAERFAQFVSWAEDAGMGVVEPFQLELTYVNVIEAPSLWDVLTGPEPAMPAAFADDVRGRPVPRLEMRYDVQGESTGGLYVHGRPRDEGFQQLDLTYRAVLKSPRVDLIPLAVAAGRRLIVSHFAELTHPALHKQMGANSVTKLAFLDDPQTSSTSGSEPDYPMGDLEERARVPVSVHAEVPGFEWLDDQFERAVRRILQLPPGWAGPGSRAVTRESLVGALEFIRRRLPVTSPRPSIVPTGPGGIQLEWHLSGLDVEVEFDAGGKVSDVAVADEQRGVHVSADSLLEVVDEIEMSLKQVDERAY